MEDIEKRVTALEQQVELLRQERSMVCDVNQCAEKIAKRLKATADSFSRILEE